MRRLIAFGAGAAAITAVLVLAAQFGWEIPEYARAQELESVRVILVAGQRENSASILVIQLNANQGAIYRNRAEQDRLGRRNASDKNLEREEIFLNQERSRLQRELRKLEK